MSEEKKRDMLFEIVEKKKLIVEKAKQELPLHELKKQVKCGKFGSTGVKTTKYTNSEIISGIL